MKCKYNQPTLKAWYICHFLNNYDLNKGRFIVSRSSGRLPRGFCISNQRLFVLSGLPTSFLPHHTHCCDQREFPHVGNINASSEKKIQLWINKLEKSTPSGCQLCVLSGLPTSFHIILTVVSNVSFKMLPMHIWEWKNIKWWINTLEKSTTIGCLSCLDSQTPSLSSSQQDDQGKLLNVEETHRCKTQ